MKETHKHQINISSINKQKGIPKTPFYSNPITKDKNKAHIFFTSQTKPHFSIFRDFSYSSYPHDLSILKKNTSLPYPPNKRRRKHPYPYFQFLNKPTKHIKPRDVETHRSSNNKIFKPKENPKSSGERN